MALPHIPRLANLLSWRQPPCLHKRGNSLLCQHCIGRPDKKHLKVKLFLIVLYSSTFCKSIVLPTASMFTLERGNSLAANIGCLPMDGCFDLSKTGLQQAGIFCNRLAHTKKYFGFCKRLAHYRVFFGRLFFISKMPLTILSSTNTKLNMF